MILITQLIYIVEGKEKVFDEFESAVIPAIKKYNGRLLLRVRPGANNFIEACIDHPYEIHLVEFATQEDFEVFMNDKERQQYLYLKEQSIKVSILIKGRQL